MDRNAFIKMSAMATIASFNHSLLAKSLASNQFFVDDIFKKVILANDNQVDLYLKSINESNFIFERKVGFDFATLVASYCCDQSRHFKNPLILPKLEILIRGLDKYQTADGTVNIGNLESPPDTAFLVEPLSIAALLLRKMNAAETIVIQNNLKQFILKAADALAIGGVHTPNHRWVISAALAKVNAVYPNKKYLNRIEDWLGEGVFIDAEGHYPERSRIYAGVENSCFITLGRLLNKPALFEPVRKNLISTYYYLEPNGDLVTTDSRRQDQYMNKTIVSYYLYYRFFAIKDNNKNFSGIAKLIETLPGFEEEILNRSLFYFLEDDLLKQEMPVPAAPSTNFEKFFTTTNLLRIRRDQKTSTLFGGVDWPLIIASGRSTNPNFFAFRKGKAILKFMRLSSNFFSMGYFYSEGIKKEGNKYILHKKLNIPYYQPLPKVKRKLNGDYKLSPSIDDRFWNKMDFANRPVSNVKSLETTIVFTEVNNTNELHFSVTGLKGVPVTIELCFAEGGKLSGVTETKAGINFLESGTGRYTFENDFIDFGPGNLTHQLINNLEGERYSTHFGNLKTKGMYVYITGTTPFEHRMVIG